MLGPLSILYAFVTTPKINILHNFESFRPPQEWAPECTPCPNWSYPLKNTTMNLERARNTGKANLTEKTSLSWVLATSKVGKTVFHGKLLIFFFFKAKITVLKAQNLSQTIYTPSASGGQKRPPDHQPKDFYLSRALR